MTVNEVHLIGDHIAPWFGHAVRHLKCSKKKKIKNQKSIENSEHLACNTEMYTNSQIPLIYSNIHSKTPLQKCI